MNNHAKTRALAEGAVMVAVAWALSYFKIRIGVWGGSIDFVMVPLVVYAVRWGAGWGMGAGLVFGTIKFFLAGGIAIGWPSIVLDYTLAFAAVGLAGVMKDRARGLWLGALVGGAARFVVHFVSGITIYAISAPETIHGVTTASPWLYSLIYNGAYMLPSVAMAMALCFALEKPMARVPKA